MTTQNLALFKALGAKMSYLDHRQRVLAQNVANADTVGYRPHDLSEVDFGRVLQKVSGDSVLRPATTNLRHMPAAGEVDDEENREQKLTYEVAPAGNSVIMEEQMVKAAQTQMDYNLMTTIYQKNVMMLQAAIGRT